MDTNILLAVVPIAGGLITAAASYWFTKKQQLELQRAESKLNHYKTLLTAISDLAIDNLDHDAHRRFANAVNTIALVGPQSVVMAVLAFHDGIKMSSTDRSSENHDRLLTALVLAIRDDLKIEPEDLPATFSYHLVGAPPPNARKRS